MWDLFGNKKKPEDIIDHLKKNSQYLPLIFKKITAIGFLNEDNDNKKTIDDIDIKTPNIYWSELSSEAGLFNQILNMFPFLTGNSPSSIMNLSWIVTLLSVAIPNITDTLTTNIRDNVMPYVRDTIGPTVTPYLKPLEAFKTDLFSQVASNLNAANTCQIDIPYGADGICDSNLSEAILLSEQVKELAAIIEGFTKPAVEFLDSPKVAKIVTLFDNIIKNSSNFVFENKSTIASIGLVVIIICSIYNLSTSQSVNKDTILNDFSLVTLFTIITQIQSIDTDSLNKPPIEILVDYVNDTYQKISFYQKVMNTTISSSFKVPKLESKKTGITRNSIKPIDIPGIKNKLTNLNIPLQSFSYALTLVKTTYVQETGRQLRLYDTDKEALFKQLAAKKK